MGLGWVLGQLEIYQSLVSQPSELYQTPKDALIANSQDHFQRVCDAHATGGGWNVTQRGAGESAGGHAKLGSTLATPWSRSRN